MRHVAPWPDFTGNPIQEGDRLVQPSGDSGIVVLLPGATDDPSRWHLDYGLGMLRGLAQAVGVFGRAVVLDETGKDL